MRRFIVSLISVCLLSFAASAVNVCEQGPQSRQNDWQSRMKAEKIAYLTSAMGLTPKEAQAFWPLYNKAEEETEKANAEFMQAFHELDQAIKSGKSSKDIEALVKKYVEAEKASRSIDAKYAPQYMKVISAEKVAKLYVGEEEFRRLQMRRWARPTNQPANNGRGK